MEYSLFLLIARVLGSAFSASSRPALTFFAVQVTAGVLFRLELVTLPSSLSWLVSIIAIGAGFGAVVVELVTQHYSEVEQTLRAINIHRFAGALSAFTSTLVLASLGAPIVSATAETQSGSASDLSNAIEMAAVSGQPLWLQITAVCTGLIVNIGLTWVRTEILEHLDKFEIGDAWQRIESGGIVVFLILLLLLPALALVVVVILTVIFAMVPLLLKLADKAMDFRRRQPCPRCSAPIRVEAFLCPHCRSTKSPTLILGGSSRKGAAAKFGEIREAVREYGIKRPQRYINRVSSSWRKR